MNTRLQLQCGVAIWVREHCSCGLKYTHIHSVAMDGTSHFAGFLSHRTETFPIQVVQSMGKTGVLPAGTDPKKRLGGVMAPQVGIAAWRGLKFGFLSIRIYKHLPAKDL